MSRRDRIADAATRALRAAGPAPIPEGLAARVTSAALAERPGGFAERFDWVVRRAALAGAAVAALTWGATLLRDRPEPLAPDAEEIAVSSWTAEVAGDGE